MFDRNTVGVQLRVAAVPEKTPLSPPREGPQSGDPAGERVEPLQAGELDVGAAVVLPALWRRSRLVVLFLRHLGCRACAEAASVVAPLRRVLLKKGIELVAVSLGSVEEGAAWASKVGWPGLLLVDESTPRAPTESLKGEKPSAVYAAFQLRRMAREEFGLDETKEAGKRMAEAGFEDWHGAGGDDEYPGDVFQLGGVFVLGPGNTCDFAYRGARFGDLPDLTQLLQVATGEDAEGIDVVYPSTEQWTGELSMRSRLDLQGRVAPEGTRPRSGSSFFLQSDAGPQAARPVAATAAAAPKLGVSMAAPVPSTATVTTTTAPLPIIDKGSERTSSDVPMQKLLALAGPTAVAVIALWLAHSSERSGWLAPFLTSVCALGVAGILHMCFAAKSSREAPKAISAPTTEVVSTHDATDDAVSPIVDDGVGERDYGLTYVLHTPEDVDDVVQASDGATCDCSPVISSIPVLGKAPKPSADSGMPPGHPEIPAQIAADAAAALRSDGSARATEIVCRDPSMVESLRVYQEMMCYFRQFLAKSHPSIGRKGPVCPFVPTSLRRNTLYVSVVRTRQYKTVTELQEAISDMIRRFVPRFCDIEPTSGRLVGHKAVVFVFPDISLAMASDVVDKVQERCKPHFVSRGLMLGEFHRVNNSPGLRNPDFYPLRTPHPALAIRHMVPTDLAFLSPSKYPADIRVQFLSSFLKVFGKEDGTRRNPKDAETIKGARVALREAELELAGETGAGAAGPSSADDPMAALLKADSGEEFRKNGHALVDWIADYRKRCSDMPVRSTVKPGYLAKLLPDKAPQAGEPWHAIMEDVESAIVPGLTHWESHKFFAYFKPHAAYASVLGELMTAGLNVMGFSWIASPVCTELEMLCLNWLAKALHLPSCFLIQDETATGRPVDGSGGHGQGGGVIQGSAGEAAIVALLAARARLAKHLGLHRSSVDESIADDLAGMMSKAVVYVSDQTHSIIHKACMVVGVPETRLRTLATSKPDFRLAPQVVHDAMLEDLRAGLFPLMVVATTGTTSSTAIDDVGAVSDAIDRACADEAAPDSTLRPWFHIDAAYGGAYAICPEFAGMFERADCADSIAVNAHKKLLVNFDCCAMWVQDRLPLLEALSLTPEYLRNSASDSGACVDYKDWQLPLGRRFRALKLWFVLRALGIEGLQAHIRNGVRLAQSFEALVRAEDGFEVFTPRTMALVCFRVCSLPAGGKFETLNDLNAELLARLNARAHVFIIHTKLAGEVVLRLAIGGVDHEDADIRAAWSEIRDQARILLAEAAA